MYKLRGEFGEAFFEGTLAECNQVRNAMIAYGILEHKLHIVYPEYHDFKLSDELKTRLYNETIDALTEGRDYSSYGRDTARDEVNDMSDYELISTYEGCIYSDEECQLLEKACKEYESFLAERVLLEE